MEREDYSSKRDRCNDYTLRKDTPVEHLILHDPWKAHVLTAHDELICPICSYAARDFTSASWLESMAPNLIRLDLSHRNGWMNREALGARYRILAARRRKGQISRLLLDVLCIRNFSIRGHLVSLCFWEIIEVLSQFLSELVESACTKAPDHVRCEDAGFEQDAGDESDI